MGHVTQSSSYEKMKGGWGGLRDELKQYCVGGWGILALFLFMVT